MRYYPKIQQQCVWHEKSRRPRLWGSSSGAYCDADSRRVILIIFLVCNTYIRRPSSQGTWQGCSWLVIWTGNLAHAGKIENTYRINALFTRGIYNSTGQHPPTVPSNNLLCLWYTWITLWRSGPRALKSSSGSEKRRCIRTCQRPSKEGWKWPPSKDIQHVDVQDTCPRWLS